MIIWTAVSQDQSDPTTERYGCEYPAVFAAPTWTALRRKMNTLRPGVWTVTKDWIAKPTPKVLCALFERKNCAKNMVVFTVTISEKGGRRKMEVEWKADDQPYKSSIVSKAEQSSAASPERLLAILWAERWHQYATAR